jgi:hypothetical protein
MRRLSVSLATFGTARSMCFFSMMLTLRPTGLSSPAYSDWADHIVLEDGRAVGRICEDGHTLPDPVAGLEGPEVVR